MNEACATTDRRRGRLLLAAAFAAPGALYLATAAEGVGGDDAAEFAWCAREWTTPHPPGFPAFVAMAHSWTNSVGRILGVDPERATCAFAAVAGATAIAVLFAAFARVLRRTVAAGAGERIVQWSAFAAAIGCALGATVWQWSNAIEVYSLQLAATALALLGIAGDDGVRRRWPAIAGVGIGIGLANHHLTMLLLLPFLPGLAGGIWRTTWLAAARRLWRAGAIAALVAATFYALMVWRAQGDYRFEFGDPGTWSRFWSHVRGGAYGSKFFEDEVDLGGRWLVIGGVVLRHLWLFAVPLALGVAALFRFSQPMLVSALGYVLVAAWIQSVRSHIPNMDAALLPALGVLSLVVACGMPALLRRRGGAWFALVAVLAQAALNFAAADRRGYEIGAAVLADLSASAPERSVVLITNWDVRMIAELHRDFRGFRPDLAILHSSLKGTNAACLPLANPGIHAAVRAEYDAFLAALAAIDPDLPFTDHYDLRPPAVASAYAAMIAKLLAVAAAEGRPVLIDRQTAALWLGMRLVRGEDVHPCGNLLSIGRLAEPRPFPRTHGWLDHPFLRHDLCALAVLDDQRIAAREHVRYYEHRADPRTRDQDAELLLAARRAHEALAAAWAAYARGKPLGKPTR